MKNKRIKQNKGITLIALVTTIIVILILAGVSINTLFGDNGLLTKANEAVDKNAEAGAYDKVETEVFASYDKSGSLDADTLKSNIEAHTGGKATLGNTNGFPVTAIVDGYTFTIDSEGNITKEGEIADGGGEQGDDPTVPEIKPEDTSYVGYYADLDGNPKNGAEGIIYADLAVGSGGVRDLGKGWKYEYSQVTDKLKQYTLEGEFKSSDFGNYTAPMVKLAEGNNEGMDRFYVMDLEDFDDNSYEWYDSAYWVEGGGLPLDKVEEDPTNFKEDSGKENTDYWLGINDNSNFQNTYGQLGDNDIWKILQGNLHRKNKDWFVPSSTEWSAFADMCVTKVKVAFGKSGDFGGFGLKYRYWSSTPYAATGAFAVDFYYGGLTGYDLISWNPVRLSTTF